MAKVVKFCAACEEGFAEKFGFCPNCGGALAAYEMNPIMEKAGVGADLKVGAIASSPVVSESPAVFEKTNEPEMEAFSTDGAEDELLEIENTPEVEPVRVAPAIVHTSFNQNYTDNGYGQNGNGSSNDFQKPAATNQTKYDTGSYHITFVEERNASGRNLLLLGALLLVTTVALGGTVYSLFNKNLLVGSLGDDRGSLASLIEDVPAPDEPEPPKKKIEKDAGGGGGGGREEETPTSKGRLAPQMPDPPMITPTKTIVQKDFELKYQATTVGNKQVAPTEDRYGDPKSKFDLASDGQGRGGGQGSGIGTGQGSGRGTGQGSGIGSGSGSGIGNGNGGGRGDGDEGDGRDNPPPVKPKGPTIGVSILSKPRPSYTDAARQNQVTGVVRLRVTFLASGQIGSVSPVSGLSYGLTEQAIAAAKQIKFEPAKANGVPQTVTKQIEYSFSIY